MARPLWCAREPSNQVDRSTARLRAVVRAQSRQALDRHRAGREVAEAPVDDRTDDQPDIMNLHASSTAADSSSAMNGRLLSDLIRVGCRSSWLPSSGRGFRRCSHVREWRRSSTAHRPEHLAMYLARLRRGPIPAAWGARAGDPDVAPEVRSHSRH